MVLSKSKLTQLCASEHPAWSPVSPFGGGGRNLVAVSFLLQPPPQTPANKTQEYLKDSTTLMGYNLF